MGDDDEGEAFDFIVVLAWTALDERILCLDGLDGRGRALDALKRASSASSSALDISCKALFSLGFSL